MLEPVPFGVGVGIDKLFSTKWFVNQLSKLEFSVIFDEVLLFKQSAAFSISDPKYLQEPFFTQWIVRLSMEKVLFMEWV